MKLKIYILTLCGLMFVTNAFCAVDSVKNHNKLDKNYYLSKPTGQYGVGFEDFDWINDDICPAPNFNGKNQEDFSPGNKKCCQEILVRIYYPTVSKNKHGNGKYYRPFIQAHQDNFKKSISEITEKQLAQLNQITIFSIEKFPVISGKTFPVLLFSPGDGSPAQAYENIIGDLVSHGYIVVGINSPIISGDIALLNGHVVKADSTSDMIEKKLYVLKPKNLEFVFEKINNLHQSSQLFSAMDLKHIGAFGHSGGASAVANITHAHPGWFQAAVTLDSVGNKYENYGELQKKFNIPFMNIIAAYNRKTLQKTVHMPNSAISQFELGNNGYLVKLSPSENNYIYSDHQNFSDISTLQYLPVWQVYIAYLEKQGHKLGSVGKGNGWEITHSINTYLVAFFDTFLKKENNALKNCVPLSKNTLIKCGPGAFG